MPTEIKSIQRGNIISNDSSVYPISDSANIENYIKFCTIDNALGHMYRFYWPAQYIVDDNKLNTKLITSELFTPGDLAGELLDIFIIPKRSKDINEPEVIYLDNLIMSQDRSDIGYYYSRGKSYSSEKYHVFFTLLVGLTDLAWVSAEHFSKHY